MQLPPTHLMTYRTCVPPSCPLPAATESEQQELSGVPTSTHPSVELQQRRTARTGSTRAGTAYGPCNKWLACLRVLQALGAFAEEACWENSNVLLADCSSMVNTEVVASGVCQRPILAR